MKFFTKPAVLSLFGVLLLLFSSLPAPAAHAQNKKYQFQTVFVYNFTKYIKWPSGGSADYFVIGVVGDSPIVPYLKKMAASKTVMGKKIVVEQFSGPNRIDECQMLYVAENQEKNIEAIAQQAKQNQSLVISESQGLATKGSDINFVRKGGRWGFELNKGSATAKGIRISSQLAQLGTVVG